MPALRFLARDAVGELNAANPGYLDVGGVVELLEREVNLDVNINETNGPAFKRALIRFRLAIASHVGSTVAPLNEILAEYQATAGLPPLLETIADPREIVIIPDKEFREVVLGINADLRSRVEGIPGLELEDNPEECIAMVVGTVRMLQVIQILLNDIDQILAGEVEEAGTA